MRGKGEAGQERGAKGAFGVEREAGGQGRELAKLMAVQHKAGLTSATPPTRQPLTGSVRCGCPRPSPLESCDRFGRPPPHPNPDHPPTLAGNTTKGFSFSARPGVSSGTGSPGKEASSRSGSAAPPLPPAAGALAGGGFLPAAAVGSSGGFSGRLSTCRYGGAVVLMMAVG